MAVMDTAIQYGGIRDALRRLPTREGGVRVRDLGLKAGERKGSGVRNEEAH